MIPSRAHCIKSVLLLKCTEIFSYKSNVCDELIVRLWSDGIADITWTEQLEKSRWIWTLL